MTTDPSAERPFHITSSRAMGVAIRHFRQSAHLTQAELAQRAGLPRETLSRLENGHETEHMRQLFAVFRQLGVQLTLEQSEPGAEE